MTVRSARDAWRNAWRDALPLLAQALYLAAVLWALWMLRG